MKKHLPILLMLLAGCLPPNPNPTPDPPKPVDPIVDPVVVTGYRVLIVEETSDRRHLSLSQLSILTSAPFRKWLTDNRVEYRIWDKETDIAGEDTSWRAMMSKRRESLPWIVIAGRGNGFSGPLPQTVQETEELIARYKP